jgi:hypothetical protein
VYGSRSRPAIISALSVHPVADLLSSMLNALSLVPILFALHGALVFASPHTVRGLTGIALYASMMFDRKRRRWACSSQL